MRCEPICCDCFHAEALDSGRYWCKFLRVSIGEKAWCQWYNGPSFPVDIAIITATDTEFRSVRRHLLPEGKEGWSRFRHLPDIRWLGATYKPDAAGDYSIRIAMAQATRQGLPASAVQAERACSRFAPKMLVMLGITAGRKGKTNIGDIVVSTLVFDYGAGKYVDGHFLPEPHQLETDREICDNCEMIKNDFQEQLQNIAHEWQGNRPETELKVRTGHSVSGAAVISDESVWDYISNTDRSVIALDMEAYSVAFAAREARERKPAVLIAKSVCDFATGKQDTYQGYAAFTSARFFRLYMKHFC